MKVCSGKEIQLLDMAQCAQIMRFQMYIFVIVIPFNRYILVNNDTYLKEKWNKMLENGREHKNRKPAPFHKPCKKFRKK